LAAAFVTGAVALLASQCPTLDALQLKELLLRTADRKASLAPYVAGGRFLNVLAATEACAAATSGDRRGGDSDVTSGKQ
jgi:hypothetical protein